MGTQTNRATSEVLPSWIPEPARHYLAHTAGGRGIRELAREQEVHASTILRQVRRTEGRRDDPLVDDALRTLSDCMTDPADSSAVMSEDIILRHGERVLRRLAEQGAVLAVARDMEMGVIVREDANGDPQRIGVVERDVAQVFALKDWIATDDPSARVVRYRITPSGRTTLRQMIYAAGVQGKPCSGFAEAQAAFHGETEDDTLVRHARSTLAESPLTSLARRRNRDGTPFLDKRLVAAGERLREDFEIAEMGRAVATDWDAFLAGEPLEVSATTDRRSRDAMARVEAALKELGPGLADVVLRCCCLLEGMEQLEGRMGWSARSGKVVLRIGLDRLRRHYDTSGRLRPRIF
jgi:hypothetical protein